MNRSGTIIEPIALPDLASDETVFSLLARAHRLGGYASAITTSRIFLGDDKAALLFDFPRRLRDLSHHLHGQLSDPVVLATTATCLPFFTRFRDRTVEERAIQKMCGQSVAALKDDLGLRACAAGPQPAVKACEDCMSEDLATLGVAYWHRVHQLPGVVMCPIHSSPLVESTRISQGKQTTLLLPDELRWVRSAREMQNAGAKSGALNLATLAAAALAQQLPGEFSAEALYHTYRHGLNAAGFLSRGNRLRLASLQKHLGSYISRLPMSVRLCRPELSRETDALADILRTTTKTFNTLPHLVLIDFLFGSWNQFVSTYEWERTMCREPDRPRGSQTNLTSANAHNGLSRVDRNSPHRDQCVAIILEYVRAHPDCTRSKLIKACGGPWRWLYRHDRSWLTANTPRPLPRSRRYGTWVNWAERDAILLESIDRERRDLALSRTSRITPNTVLRTLGTVPFSVRLEKMPRSAARLAEIAEQIRCQRRYPAADI
ncbi:TnsD family transposase [Burkholderia glumae]|uniref:TnsD family transposase n=1 Tax=Burkholderia glumae TaxID=337 RepID=UPI00203754A7|nr:TnsD family transposase [Burkholderia glumae]MCM2482396.1 TnsD family transposase [Burkholderia glumae]MCM2507460.1 TnsD family transposase [Burkholderia glumae]